MSSNPLSNLLNARFWLCGPLGFLLAVVVMLGMALWFPGGTADIDNIVLPLVLFPALWAGIFFFAYLEPRLKRIWCVFALLGIPNTALIAAQFWS